MQYLSVHGHFYQPPRENPFTGVIPNELGADPFHDWYERISFECYEPMARLGLLDQMSFNLGPTLARWLEKARPETYQRILEADRVNYQRHGVGNALAQVYNHTILPLASQRDKLTQIRWGLADFRHRFGREAQAVFLAECAVDLATLKALVDCGLEFALLAEWQAAEGRLNVTRPYRVRLPGGRALTVCFFHGALGWNIHNPRMADPETFARYALPMTLDRPRRTRGEPQLVLSACDGEYFGHHDHGRIQWLREVLCEQAPREGWKVTFPGLYLQAHPATEELELAENTAWSCMHGLERWNGRCPCEPADFQAETPPWKGPLRDAMDALKVQLDALFEQHAGPRGWQLRDAYSDVLLGLKTQEEFSQGDRVLQLLLESQLLGQWMYTSCGWFFEDPSRIEPLNNLAYAARAIHCAREATGVDLEPAFRAALQAVRSWRTGQSGEELYLSRVAPGSRP